ncbi:MAG: helix-turn-helix transcriptional regulator, partial [Actinobacteria bacterium]|nr:helix-turn-helix transcriptional regulator [Actinomycetota bacterium]
STIVVPADFTLLQANLGLSFLIVILLIGYILLPREQDIKNLAIIDYGEQAQAPASVHEATLAAGVGTGAAETGNKADNPNRFAMRCQRVADTYLLSARETEILFLLAKGRNAAFIQKELYISEGTARTHMWRIYKKLNIHTQQELMDLIDSER